MQKPLPTAALARLSPPPGGEGRLRDALHERDHRRQHWGLPLAGAFACLCVVAVLLTLRPDPLDAEIRSAVTDAATLPPDGIRVAGSSLERLESGDPSVRLYRIAAAHDLP